MESILLDDSGVRNLRDSFVYLVLASQKGGTESMWGTDGGCQKITASSPGCGWEVFSNVKVKMAGGQPLTWMSYSVE